VIEQEAAVIGDVIEAQRRIVDEFELVDGWIERYETLIDFGRRLAPMPASLRTERNRIRACQGDAWLAASRKDGRLYLSAASETDVLAGLPPSSSKSIPGARRKMFSTIRSSCSKRPA
jgi:sulfur transfer protein SufE